MPPEPSEPLEPPAPPDPPEPLARRRVADLATPTLLTLYAGESIATAWELMELAGVEHLPVVDGQGHCVGVLDLHTLGCEGGPVLRAADRPVTDLVTPSVTVRQESTVRQAARAMLDAGRDHVVVTGPDARIVGLLTARDLLGALAGAPSRTSPHTVVLPALQRPARAAGAARAADD
ncbi:CBS domain-containing protein [Actinomadura parmotrematis]|uniref:CBS domain-containing protein n=1 Tax=Actinomadura parmotrematis TaxID=2864039 RepID=A0ABS7FPU6_9ACTN|nr:CBS domain-containing protein [Actinomadura parmotrematis]MBW8482413.1 CBS domain-containing protein [Actinomadura parmotrematis]